MNDNKIQSIQMIGTQRSGSNLLRVMLNASESIFAPHPPHILQRFLPLLPLYRELTSKTDFQLLIQDICDLIHLNPVPWEGVELFPEEVLKACKKRSLYEVYRVCYDQASRQVGASFWLNKSMQNMYYAEDLETAGIKSLYVYLFRDGRDVALSFQKAVVGEKNIYMLAKQWKQDQEAALAVARKVSSNRFFQLSYEELLQSPEKTLSALCLFIKIPYTDNMLNYYCSTESIHTASGGDMWSNVSKPLLKQNTQKFLKEMSKDDLIIFESIAGDTLLSLGYQLYTSELERRVYFSMEEIDSFQQENENLKKRFVQEMDAKDKEKRQAQAELLAKIKKYKL